MTSWTSGPWIVSDGRHAYKHVDDLADGHSGYVIAKALTHSLIGANEADANLRLIATAPELYEALARLLTWVKPLVSGTDREEIDSIEHACVALRKARGE